jgi:hypothetical protein
MTIHQDIGRDQPLPSRRREAPVELIATVLLALSTLVAVTVVSISSVHSWRCMDDSLTVARVST